MRENRRELTKFLVAAAGTTLMVCASVSARPHPTDGRALKVSGKHLAVQGNHGGGSGTRADFVDDFESYALGGGIAGQNGWEIWPGGLDVVVMDDTAAGGAQSIKLLATGGLTDVVHGIDGANSGQWVISVMTYVPSNPDVLGDGYFIVLNDYDGGGANTNWSMQVRFGSLDFLVESQFDFNILPLIPDQWVELRAEVDLDADLFTEYYGGDVLAADLIWTQNVSGGGQLQIHTVDLFSNGLEPWRMDELGFTSDGGCYADCNGDGTVNTLDFLCFLNLFSNGDPAADCNGDGTINTLDFLCFLNAFNEGC